MTRDKITARMTELRLIRDHHRERMARAETEATALRQSLYAIDGALLECQLFEKELAAEEVAAAKALAAADGIAAPNGEPARRVPVSNLAAREPA